MPRMILGSIFVVLMGIIIAKFIWVGFTVNEVGNVIGNAQVNIAMNDARLIRQSLEVIPSNYSLEEKFETYQTSDYDVFKAKVEEVWDNYGGMPFEFPSGQNFTGFSYTGGDGYYHIILKAKDKNSTLVHGTLHELWHD